MLQINLEIPGRPITKKNHQRIIVVNGRRKVIYSKEYAAYRKFCLGDKRSVGWLTQFGNQYIPGPVWMRCLYYLPNRRSEPDLLGLLQATSDLMQEGGFIENDRLVRSYDGSRVLFDAENPRVEIMVRQYE